MVDFYDQNSTMNSLHNPSLEGNSIVGRKRTKNMMGQHTLDLMGISGCWAGLFQPFPLPESQAVVLCWDVFACQLSAVVFTGSVSKHLHPEAVLKELRVGTLTVSVDGKKTTSPVVQPPFSKKRN